MASNRCWAVRDLVDPALPLKLPDRLPDLALSDEFNGLFQLGVLLAEDLVKMNGSHPGFLHLLEGTTGFHRLVLASITHQQHPILFFEALEKLIDEPCARQAGFIHHIKVPLITVSRPGLGEKVLQRGRGNARLLELVSGAGGWGKTLDPVALGLGTAANGSERRGFARPGDALQAADPIPAIENLFRRLALCGSEVLELRCDPR